jgi:endoglycosylceramidase
MRRAACVAFAGAIALAGCGSASSGDASQGPPPAYRVEGGAVLDAAGRTVVLRGANVSGAHKSAPYWSSLGPADYARLRDEWGFDSMRLLVLWAGLEPQKGQYDEGYLDELAKRVGWARDAGLLVVLDMHQDLYGEGFAGGDGAPRWTCDEARYAAFEPTTPWFFGTLDPNVEACVDALYADGSEPRAHLVEAWRRVARKLASFDNVIGFDPLNEPSWGSYDILGFEPDRLAPFYLEVAKAVRAEAAAWLLFAEPSASRNVGYPSHLPKLPVDGVVYAPHSYDNDAEGGAGFDAAHRDGVLSRFRDLRAEADAMGAALWIGEYGADTTKPGLAAYMDAEYDGAASVGAGSTYWAYDRNTSGYGLLEDDGAVKVALADVLARPYPSRVAGKLSAWDYDEASRALTVHMTPDRAIAAPTEIVVPARAYPGGVRVDCGGCDVEVLSGLVRLRTAPAGDVVVRPP